MSGVYFANQKPRQANQLAYDPTLTARLWQVSADLTSISPSSDSSDSSGTENKPR